MSKKILPLEFHDYASLPKDEGLKMVMFRLEDTETTKLIGYDWGFANFSNGEFEVMETDGVKAWVVKWAVLPHPKILF